MSHITAVKRCRVSPVLVMIVVFVDLRNMRWPMHIVYFSHSYRDVDARVVDHFAQLLRIEGVTLSLDPPSSRVNAAKLERHLNASDGMIAVLTIRDGGVSPHILYEIGLCRRARRPLLVLVEDQLPDSLIPSRILQRRFSRRSYLRQVREHRHALQIFKAYLGQEPPPRYQPSTSRRSCVLLGTSKLPSHAHNALIEEIEHGGYAPMELSGKSLEEDELAVYDTIACADAWPEKIAHENALTMAALARTSETFMLDRIKALSDQRHQRCRDARRPDLPGRRDREGGVRDQRPAPDARQRTVPGAAARTTCLDLLVLDTIQTQFDRFRSRGRARRVPAVGRDRPGVLPRRRLRRR